MNPILYRIPFSHYCQKVEWAFTHAGIPYDAIDISLIKMPRLPKVTRDGTVPILEVDGVLIEGSGAIMAWIAEACPELDWYPEGALEWEQQMDAEMGPVARREAYRVAHGDPFHFNVPFLQRLMLRAVRPILLNVMKYYKVRRYDEEDRLARARLTKDIAAQLGNKPLLFGAAPSAADFATAALARPLLYVADARGYEGEDWQRVEQYVLRLKPESTSVDKSRKIREKDWKRLEALASRY
ncbi:MAG: glutathione S-transferase family protein [Thermoplasmatota archaeon]